MEPFRIEIVFTRRIIMQTDLHSSITMCSEWRAGFVNCKSRIAETLKMCKTRMAKSPRCRPRRMSLTMEDTTPALLSVHNLKLDELDAI